MKQKVLGATLVLSAPVNSFASYSSKGDGKVDLSKLENIDAIFDIAIKKSANETTKLGDMNIKEGSNDKKFKDTAKAENFKKDFKFTLLTGHTGNDCDKDCVKTFKCETESDGKKLKINELTGNDQKNIGPGTYVLVTLTNNGSEVTVEKKVFEKKQKLEGKEYKDDESK